MHLDDVENPMASQQPETEAPAGPRPAADAMVMAAAPGLESKYLWAADGSKPSLLAQLLRVYVFVLLVLELVRSATGNMSQVTWDVLNNKDFYA
eukprot:SAG22_NODE_12948_length_424_cov_0.523077_1_plen_93_part_10